LNFSKSTLGISAGLPGARYTVNSKGRRTFSTGIPGTGLYDVTTLSSGRPSDAAPSRGAVSGEQSEPDNSDDAFTYAQSEPMPGLFARKSERALHAYLRDIYGYDQSVHGDGEVVTSAAALKDQYPDLAAMLDLLTVVHGSRDEDEREILNLAQTLWDQRGAIFGDRRVGKYGAGIYLEISISRGISFRSVLNEAALGFILSELYQEQGDVTQAIEILNQMEPSQLIGLALADLEVTSGEFDGALETTEDIENVDDATAMMLILRGIAFREKDLNDAALECFRRALAKKSRAEGVLHRALYERALTYKKVGKKASARKDLEKILVDDPDALGVPELLAQL
jgi:tetratricopeptide (TPR) repeat protein